MVNKTCLITGSTSGIGKATALALANLGWHIILHGRNELLCQKTKEEIITATGNNTIDYLVCDLSLMKEVDKMANRIIREFPDLNILINNAGIFNIKRSITAEGRETTWAVNYLSRFLLVNRLLDLLKKNAPSRIIEVAGAYHAKGIIHFDDINLEKTYSAMIANNQAKLANVLFTYKLAENLSGSGVTVNCLHPGAVNTGSVLKASDVPFLMKFFYKFTSVFFRSPQKGAETSVYLASSSEVEGINGKYFIDKKERKSSPATYDRELQDKLWKFSTQLIKSR